MPRCILGTIIGSDRSLIAMPGNASTMDGRFLDPKAFPSAAYCGHCHQQAYQEWRQALHSNSFRTPFYRTSVNILARTKGSSSRGTAIAATTRSVFCQAR